MPSNNFKQLVWLQHNKLLERRTKDFGGIQSLLPPLNSIVMSPIQEQFERLP
jgi:hypothetical protein